MGVPEPSFSSDQSNDNFDVLGNLRLLPKFSEKDFFSLFECLAEARHWPDPTWTTMLQCVLTGRAQEAYSALSELECQSYTAVKAAVYELVPEAYQQCFRLWGKK